MPRVEESLAHLSYPGRATFFLRFLNKLANRLHEKQKVGSASRASLSSYEHFDYQIDNQIDNQGVRERCFQLLTGAEGSTSGDPLFSGSYKRVLFLTTHKIRPNIAVLFCSNFLTSYHQLIVCFVCSSQAELIRRYDTTLKKPRGD